MNSSSSGDFVAGLHEKTLIWLLDATMLLGTLLASCAENQQTDDETGNDSTARMEETVTGNDTDDLGGRDITMISRTEVVNQSDVYVEEMGSDPINLYCRSFKFTAESIRTIHATGINTVSSLIRQYETSTRAMIEKLNENLQEVIDQTE